MQGLGNLIVLLQPRTAPQDLGQPELADGTLHVGDLALGRRRGLHPLGGLAADTADHVGMGEGLGRPLGLGLLAERRRDGLGDAGVQRRGATGDDERGILIAGRWTVAGSGADEGRGVFE